MKNGLERVVPGIIVLLNPDKVCLLMLLDFFAALLIIGYIQPFFSILGNHIYIIKLSNNVLFFVHVRFLEVPYLILYVSLFRNLLFPLEIVFQPNFYDLISAKTLNDHIIETFLILMFLL